MNSTRGDSSDHDTDTGPDMKWMEVAERNS